ncbi:MAG: inorganic pyrophosphatase [Anaerolineales bacterium]|nr:inorganic pyrophosphatase [Anaerolineales bacterium]
MSFPDPYYRWRPHPWHGLSPGPNPPKVINAFIEITPFDLIKYEVDKETGYLRVDRPQRTSSLPPTLYGFIPRTYCGNHVTALCDEAEKSDGDPLDICVISERPINRSEVILTVRVIGGMQMIDKGEADDKIIAVLDSDDFWEHAKSISDIPPNTLTRIEHYFNTYKIMEEGSSTYVAHMYDAKHARKVVSAAMLDYETIYGQ